MLYAVVSKDLYRYETDALLHAFYPGEEVRTVLEEEDKREAAGADPFLYVRFARDRISLEITPASGERKQASAAAPDGAGPLDDKSPETRDLYKHLLYETLCAVTGRTLPWGELIGVRPTKIAMKQLEAGSSVEEAARYMTERHYCSSEKAMLAVDIAARERELLDPGLTEGWSLYVSIPYCPTTCMYCSFPSYPLAGRAGEVRQYLAALASEMRLVAELMEGRRLDTVYFGGGTPTALSADELRFVLDLTASLFDISRLKEWTVEAGRPDSITEDKLAAMRQYPVTRISVNPQTMNDETLKIIGRRHTAQQTADAFRMARACGFDNINMDIILGLPGEGLQDVRHTLAEIEKLSPESLTVHSLAVKKGSRLQEYIAEAGYGIVMNGGGEMETAIGSAVRMGMKPYYLYRQKNMTGDQENIGFAKDGKYGLYNILMMEEIQSVAAVGAGSVSKIVRPGGKIVRSDDPKEVSVYIDKIEELCARRREVFNNSCNMD